MNATRARGKMNTSAPEVKNGYFTYGKRKCDSCGSGTNYGGKGVCYGTYHCDGEELCRVCAKRIRVI